LSGRLFAFAREPVVDHLGQSFIQVEVIWSSALLVYDVVDYFGDEFKIPIVSRLELQAQFEEMAEFGGKVQNIGRTLDCVIGTTPHVTFEVFETDILLKMTVSKYGPRSLQMRIFASVTHVRDALELRKACSFQTLADEQTLAWAENATEVDLRMLTIEVAWIFPIHTSQEIATHLVRCFRLGNAMAPQIYEALSAMNKLGPSTESFQKYMPEYVVTSSNVFINCSSMIDFESSFPSVRFHSPPTLTSSFSTWNHPGHTTPLPPPPIPDVPSTFSSSVAVVLTVYKRHHFLEQIVAILAQTIVPRVVYICQNENHVDIRQLVEVLAGTNINHELLRGTEIVLPLPFEIHHIHSPTLNQKYHGRFAFLNMVQEDFVALFDDDKIPGKRWLEHSLSISESRRAIVGYSGRLWAGSQTYHIPMYRLPTTQEVDYVGQCWVFRSEWIRFMWHDRPVTFQNGTDIDES
jgi:hypothetical protein